jgi:hypothetical protein
MFPGQPGVPDPFGVPGQPGFADPFAQPGFPGASGQAGFPGSVSQPGFRRGVWSPGLAGFDLARLRRRRFRALIAMAVVMLIAIGVIFSIAHSRLSPSPSGSCIGGPVTGSAGQPVGNGDYRFPCSGGGSTVIHLGN